MKPSVQVEICCFSLEDVIASIEGGADRIELCVDPALGGVTPSFGLVKTVRTLFPDFPCWVIIRPRGGHFVFSKREALVMKEDIRVCKDLGIDGVVVGVLNDSSQIDKTMLEDLLDQTSNMGWAFHRAFDQIKDRWAAYHYLISRGCSRVLTSAGGGNAVQNASKLQEEASILGDQIQIMVGGNVRAENVAAIIGDSEIGAVHSSLRNGTIPPGEFQDISATEVENLVSVVRSVSRS